MRTTRLSASLIALLSVAVLVPVGFAIEPLPTTPLAEVSLGLVYTESFDDDAGNWTASPLPDLGRPAPVSSWEWGAPTSGPGAAFSGSNVWATNLAGTYGASECGAILSPPIDLTDATSASVSFMQWRHMDQTTTGSKFVNDAGRFFVTADGGDTLTVVQPDQGNNGPMTSTTSVRVCFDQSPTGTQAIGGPPGSAVPAPVYSAMSADLTAFAGSVVQFAIAFASTSTTHRAGWYIDDFTVNINGGVSSVQDFESGDGGFTVIGTANADPQPLGWDWAAPIGDTPTGSPMWATNTQGDHGNRECAWIESPVIDLSDLPSAAAGPVSLNLSWDQWFRSNSVYGAGIVQVGVVGENGTEYEYVVPDGGYPADAAGTYEDQLAACLGEESLEGSFAGLHQSTTADMVRLSADLSPFLGASVTVRFFFATAWSYFNPAVNEGWYIDNVDIEQTVVVVGPDAEQIADDVIDDADNPMFPGWTTGGTASTWAYGLVSDAGPAGDVAFATNLTGTHARECSWIQSPPIPGSLVADDPLIIRHWFHQYYSTSSGTAWNGGAVLVSTDDGATWQYLDLPEYTSPGSFSGLRDCIRSVDPTAPSSPRVFSGEQTFYTTVSIDLSAFAEAPNVQVCFLQGTGIGIYRPGWYIDSVTLGDVPLVA